MYASSILTSLFFWFFYAALLAAYILLMISLSRNIHVVLQYMGYQKQGCNALFLYITAYL